MGTETLKFGKEEIQNKMQLIDELVNVCWSKTDILKLLEVMELERKNNLYAVSIESVENNLIELRKLVADIHDVIDK